MSHLARELDRHVTWIEQQEEELREAVEGLVRDVQGRRSSTGTWDEQQVQAIDQAVRDLGDNVGRSIAVARREVDDFHRALLHALELGQ